MIWNLTESAEPDNVDLREIPNTIPEVHTNSQRTSFLFLETSGGLYEQKVSEFFQAVHLFFNNSANFVL